MDPPIGTHSAVGITPPVGHPLFAVNQE